MIAPGQAAVEHAVITGAGAGAAAAGAGGTGKSVGGVFGSLSKTIESGQAKTSPPAPGAPQAVQTPAPRSSAPAPAVIPLDPSRVKVGMTRAALDALGSTPTFASHQTRGGITIETLWFQTPNDGEMRVDLREGKIANIRLSSGKSITPR
jgi:Flp pilus assembly pilin Flp